MAYHIGEGKPAALQLLEKTRLAVGEPSEPIYTDGNSCYSVAFKPLGLRVQEGKDQTHLIESSNAQLRDNLARFNRRSKRFSKQLYMLDLTLFLFFNRHLIPKPTSS